MTIEINLFEAMLPGGPTVVLLMILAMILLDKQRQRRAVRTRPNSTDNDDGE